MNVVANEAYLGVADALSREGSLERRHLPTPNVKGPTGLVQLSAPNNIETAVQRTARADMARQVESSIQEEGHGGTEGGPPAC